ncbi:response regulator transcription factor [Nocardia aobensis]|uniref:Response regulator transcription factor n=1 Tax=Nocardia aobensis TaxID=257277 RepID=A0ABW6PF99_9NOCA
MLLVDDQAAVRRSLRSYLESLEIDVVGEACDGHEALSALDDLRCRGELPDVVLMDLVMPAMDGVLATGWITRQHPGIRVIVLTGFGQLERTAAAIANGAESCLLKDAPPAEIARAVLDGSITVP